MAVSNKACKLLFWNLKMTDNKYNCRFPTKHICEPKITNIAFIRNYELISKEYKAAI
jgi:hypothetical protein